MKVYSNIMVGKRDPVWYRDGGDVVRIESRHDGFIDVAVRAVGDVKVLIDGEEIDITELAWSDQVIKEYEDIGYIEWVHNPWFELFEVTQNGNEYSTTMEIYHDAYEAIIAAMRWSRELDDAYEAARRLAKEQAA